MDLPPEELLVHTLGLLEWRLQRLEFVLNGGLAQDINTTGGYARTTVSSRLQKLEQSLNQLAGKSDTIAELLRLRMCTWVYFN
jgi:hypothetical protein